ncbi:MAG: aminopeptidase [Acidobacteria bacterium]|nr:aminopeptidase [Acidobacteriota bacterium]
MIDPRYEALAKVLIEHSCALGPGDKVLIDAIDVPTEFATTLMRTAVAAGAHPVVQVKNQRIHRQLLHHASEEQLGIVRAAEIALMSRVDAYVGVRGNDNVSELSDVPPDKMRRYEEQVWKPVHMDIRVPKTRWVVLRWPSPSMAQLAEMSTEAFEDFYFRVCTMDYAHLHEAMQPLKELMERTDRVRLVSQGTDLSFSITGIPAICCSGQRNIPDGEVFTAPVRDSVEGTIQFNTPTIYQGVTHNDVRLTFRDGRVVDSTSSEPEHLRSVLDTDEGARYVGEFAIGLNPHVTKPMKDILFDEKIGGSIHFTPGAAYDEAFNGNRSQIHWDLVLRMDPAQGGGEVYFDDTLVRKDGRFVLPALEPLNPENLA